MEAEVGRSFPAMNLITSIVTNTAPHEIDERRCGFASARYGRIRVTVVHVMVARVTVVRFMVVRQMKVTVWWHPHSSTIRIHIVLCYP